MRVRVFLPTPLAAAGDSSLSLAAHRPGRHSSPTIRLHPNPTPLIVASVRTLTISFVVFQVDVRRDTIVVEPKLKVVVEATIMRVAKLVSTYV